jgi:DNA replication protein DnaC
MKEINPCRTPWQRKRLALDITHPKLQELADIIEKYGQRFHRKESGPALLVIVGNPSTGKSRIVRAICEWARLVEPDSMFLHWPHVATRIYQKDYSLVTRATGAPLAGIDDLGAEHDPFKNAADHACQLLSAREKKPTVLTTNIDPANWHEFFGHRIAERLLRNSQVVHLIGVPSYVLR